MEILDKNIFPEKYANELREREGINDLLREGKGLEAVKKADELKILDVSIISDALDIETENLVFARQRGNAAEIEQIESKIAEMEEMQKLRNLFPKRKNI